VKRPPIGYCILLLNNIIKKYKKKLYKLVTYRVLSGIIGMVNISYIAYNYSISKQLDVYFLIITIFGFFTATLNLAFRGNLTQYLINSGTSSRLKNRSLNVYNYFKKMRTITVCLSLISMVIILLNERALINKFMVQTEVVYLVLLMLPTLYIGVYTEIVSSIYNANRIFIFFERADLIRVLVNLIIIVAINYHYESVLSLGIAFLVSNFVYYFIINKNFEKRFVKSDCEIVEKEEIPQSLKKYNTYFSAAIPGISNILIQTLAFISGPGLLSLYTYILRFLYPINIYLKSSISLIYPTWVRLSHKNKNLMLMSSFNQVRRWLIVGHLFALIFSLIFVYTTNLHENFNSMFEGQYMLIISGLLCVFYLQSDLTVKARLFQALNNHNIIHNIRLLTLFLLTISFIMINTTEYKTPFYICSLLITNLSIFIYCRFHLQNIFRR